MPLTKKIIASLCAISICFATLVPSSLAAPVGEIVGVVWTTVEFLDMALNKIEDWRTANPDKDISEYPGYNPGGTFGGGADRAEAEKAYTSYVSDLQTDLGSTTLIDGGVRYYINTKPVQGDPCTVLSASLSGVNWSVVFRNTASNRGPWLTMDSLVAPCNGKYSTGYSYSSSASECVLKSMGTSSKWADSVYVESGEQIYPSTYKSLNFAYIDAAYAYTDYTATGCFWIDFYPSSASLPTTQDITINSRPTSITGDYGIMGDNGTITKVDGNVIVDESASTVYNPVTNTTTNFTNWSYDYSDRSYNLTTEAGDTITVTYGDENITINEGDTIYNVYYVIPQEQQQPSDPGTDPGIDHTHTYTDEITKQPTCLLSGVRTYTCSCGDSYTKTVPATGHDWQISQQVPNTYDPETGEQTQTGYTVYTCATCGEQYKSTDGAAPPNGSTGDDSSGGIGGVLSGLLGAVGDVIAGLIEGALTLATKAMEALTGLGDLVSQMIETVLGFFGGFIDFLAAMFPFLPEETFTILNLGLILMIAAAVFRKFLN